VSVLTTTLLVAAAGAVGWRAIGDHRKALTGRKRLLDGCMHMLDRPVLTHADDGFPHLSGRIGPSRIDVRLISDTMTMRRLPQLWLQVTVLEHLPHVAGLAILVRPAGYEFYSLTERFHHVIDTPPGFPAEVIVRGEKVAAARVLDALAEPLRAILSDPKVKEVAVTPAGWRIIRQTAEGRRGEHLLLRQAVFDNAEVAPQALKATLEEIDALRAGLAPRHAATYGKALVA